MNYPKTLKIGDRTYRVRFVRSIRGCKKPGFGTVGYYDPKRKEILIKVGMSKDETLKTLLHEVVHAIHNEYDIKLSHRGVYKFEEALFDFFCANLESFSNTLK